MLALVTVFPVPGGPWIKHRGKFKAIFMAYYWEEFNLGSPGTYNF